MNTTANKLTIARIAMIPVFLLLAYSDHTSWAFLVYVLACVTDAADGYIARHYNQTSTFGKFMDPLADKMLVLSAMCYFIEAGLMPGWCVAIVIFREFAVSGLRLLAAEKQRVIAAAPAGKLKTGATMVGLGAMLVFGWSGPLNFIVNAVILITTVVSGVQYFLVNRDVFHE